MSVNEALGYCPTLQVIPPNHLLYHELSHKLFMLLQKLIPKIEQFSIDEFFCDISGMREESEPYKFALHVKQTIWKELSLPVSIGIANSKWTAKLATNDAKPDGILLVKDNEVLEYIKDKPIGDFPGIGKGYAKRLQSYGIQTLGEVALAKKLFYQWKKPGIQLYKRITGQDCEKIEPRAGRKSIGISRTFDAIKDREELRRRVVILARHITYMVNRLSLHPSTFYLKVKYEYNAKNKNTISQNRLFNEKMLRNIMLELFDKTDIYKSTGVIYFAMSVSNFIEYTQKSVSLIEFNEDILESKLNESMQKIRNKYGLDAIRVSREV